MVLPRMLVAIKKVMVYLGGLSLVLIVIEELLQDNKVSEHSPRSSLRGSVIKQFRINESRSHDLDQTVFPPFDEPMKTQEITTRPTDSNTLEVNTRTVASLVRQDTQRFVESNTTFSSPQKKLNNTDWSRNHGSRFGSVTALDDDDDADAVEKEKLRRSPYIYHEDVEWDRHLTTPSQKTVKLVSYFLPWDKDRLKANSFRGCQYSCRYVSNMSEADGVLFRAAHVRDHVIPSFHRPRHQRWILFTTDPAIKSYDLERPDVKSNFNWTMTYQLHSDLPNLFGLLKKRKVPPRDFERIYEKKNKMAAWFVSHCPTWGRREVYIDRMRAILPVDIFGKCGNLSCGPIHYRGKDSTECLPMLTDHYKFYLAFENSFCKDYISEKFFKLFQDVDVIPVVRGGFNYKKYLPSGIFVDASDFKTPEDLARHLLQLGQNKIEYVRMLRRKSRWVGTSNMAFQCIVCQGLHTAGIKPHYYDNLRAKFNGDPSDCWPPRDLGPNV